jgi:hypothetical protein
MFSPPQKTLLAPHERAIHVLVVYSLWHASYTVNDSRAHTHTHPQCFAVKSWDKSHEGRVKKEVTSSSVTDVATVESLENTATSRI